MQILAPDVTMLVEVSAGAAARRLVLLFVIHASPALLLQKRLHTSNYEFYSLVLWHGENKNEHLLPHLSFPQQLQHGPAAAAPCCCGRTDKRYGFLS